MSDDPILGALRRCSILFQGEKIPDATIVSVFSNYIVRLLDVTEKSNGIIYHTGSKFFDILLIVYIAMSCLVYDKLTPQDVVTSLNPGDLIIYKGKTRAEFLGIDEKGFAKIQYGLTKDKYCSPITETVSPVSFYKIKPYQGVATLLDGRGIRNDSKAKIEFMKFVFGKDQSDISGINRKSAIIVCNRNFSDGQVHFVV